MTPSEPLRPAVQLLVNRNLRPDHVITLPHSDNTRKPVQVGPGGASIAKVDRVTGSSGVGGLPPPAPLESATVVMAWHPRFDADPAHTWFRQEIVTLVRSLSTSANSS